VPTKKVTKIVDAKITHVSLVSTPANNETFLMMKSNGNVSLNFAVNKLNILKSESDEEKLVYGVVYSPNTIDLQGEYAEEKAIEKMANDFMTEFGNIDEQHSFLDNIGKVAQSYICVQDTEINGSVVKKGSWVMVVKCNDEAWEKVKKGELNGFSMAGMAKKVQVDVDVDESGEVVGGSAIKHTVNKIADTIKGFFQKDFNSQAENYENNNMLHGYLNVLCDVIYDSYYDGKMGEEMKAEIETAVMQFLEKINGMSFVYKNLQKQAEINLQKEDVSKQLVELQEKFAELEKSNKELADENTELKTDLEKSLSLVEKSTETIEALKKASLNSSQIASAPTPAEKKKYSLV